MNREEAIEKWVIPALKNTWNEKRCNEVLEALEQEPCDDAISRQDLREPRFIIAENDYQKGWNDALDSVYENAPSVTPAEKVGQWVFVKGYEGILYECTACKNKNTHTTVRWNYCPHSGVKMREVES